MHGGIGMRLILTLVLVVFLVSPALAWHSVTASSADTDGPVTLATSTTISNGDPGASVVQVKNNGTGQLRFSVWWYTGLSWEKLEPYGTGAGEPFVTVADSAIVLNEGESFKVENSARRQHLVYIERITATSYTVAWK